GHLPPHVARPTAQSTGRSWLWPRLRASGCGECGPPLTWRLGEADEQHAESRRANPGPRVSRLLAFVRRSRQAALLLTDETPLTGVQRPGGVRDGRDAVLCHWLSRACPGNPEAGSRLPRLGGIARHRLGGGGERSRRVPIEVPAGGCPRVKRRLYLAAQRLA